jgi:hypothetical protein
MFNKIDDFVCTRSSDTEIYLWWKSLYSVVSYLIEKSVDKGISFSTVATVVGTPAYDNINWDIPSQKFFYVDTNVIEETVYRIRGSFVGDIYTDYEYVYVVPVAITCNIFGNISSLDGKILSESDRSVIIESIKMGSDSGEKPKVVKASSEGYWQVALVAGSHMKITIPCIRDSIYVKIPDNPGLYNYLDLPRIAMPTVY